MDFGSADHGVNIPGMNQYIEDLNTIVLTEVASTLRNTNDVVTAVRAGWHGDAPEQFIMNLNKAAEKMVDELKNIQQALEVELKGIQSEIIDMDANLVEEE